MPGMVVNHIGWMSTLVQMMLNQYGPATVPTPMPAIVQSAPGPVLVPNIIESKAPAENILVKPITIINPPPSIVGVICPVNGAPITCTPLSGSMIVSYMGGGALLATGNFFGNQMNAPGMIITPTGPSSTICAA